MKTLQSDKQKAFTLVELLIAIGAIALLAALVYGGMGTVRESAKTATSIKNLKQIGVATHLYVSENRGMLPRADGRDTDPGFDWPTGLRRYGVSYYLPDPPNRQNPIMLNPAGYSPEYSPTGIKSSYCMNGNLQNNSRPPPEGESIAPVFPIPLSSVEAPSKTVLFADSMYAARAMNYGHLAYRNNNKTAATMVFVDGHAEARRREAVSFEQNFANPPRPLP